MNISLHIEAVNPAELQEAIAGLAGIVNSSVISQPKSEKRQSTPKSEKQSDPEQKQYSKSDKADTQPESEQENPGKVEAQATDELENIPTVVELRAKAQEKGTTPEGKKAIKALLDVFGSKSISDVPEEKRSEFLLKLEVL